MRRWYFCFEEGSNINQIICAILISLPVFVYGASIGWMSPMGLLLQSKDSPRGTPLTDTEISWMAAAGYLTCVPADFMMAYMGDRLGRKFTLMFMSAITALCWIFKLSSMDTWAFVTARALVGIIMAGACVTCPAYTKEISEKSIRGTLGGMLIFAQTSGNLFLYIIGDLLSYRTILWVCLAIPTTHLVLFLIMPESPSYLVKKGNDQEAKRVLAWLRCRDEDDQKIEHELEELKREQKADDKSSEFVLKNIFTDSILFRAFRIAMIVSLAREVCGAIPLLNFAGEIFTRASTSLVLSPNQQAMMLGVVQVAGSVLGSSVVERLGRKPLLFITSLVAGLSMVVVASWFFARDQGVHAPGWIPVVILCLQIFCDASGLQPVSVVLIGEMFSFKYRSTVMATSTAASSMASFFQVRFFKPIAAALGVHVVFYFYGVVCLATAVYVIVSIPETKMRSVSEIQDCLKTRKEKMKELEKAEAIEIQSRL